MVNKKQCSLSDKDCAHPWLIDNAYLLSGYRKNFNSAWLSIRSLFMVHNELMNIWTHLVGAILFVLVMALSVRYYNGNAQVHTSVKNMFEISDTFKHIHSYYEENSNLLFDLIHSKERFDRTAFQSAEDEKHQAKSRVAEVIDKYAKVLEDVVELVTTDEMQLIQGFNARYEYVQSGVSKTIRVLRAKYNNLVSAIDTDIEALYDGLRKCFHSDTVSHILASNLHPHLEYSPIVIYTLCAIACLGFSAIFHTFTSMSYKVHKILHKLDMAGISFLNFGSSYAVFYYAFYCRPIALNIYATTLFVACLTVFIVTLGDKIHKAEYVTYKGLMFAFLGLSNVVPFTHLCILSAYASPENDNMPFNIAFIGVCIMAALYLTGLVIYVIKFPERYYPKKFDIWLNSHVIWHLFVMSAAAVHFFNVVYAYKVRKYIHCLSC